MRGKGETVIWRDFLPLAIVVASGLLLGVSAFMATRGYYRDLQRQQFRREAADYATAVQGEIRRHLTALSDIRAFVSAAQTVTRWEFSNYAHQVLPENPGFKAVLWVPEVAAANRGTYEAALQKDGLFGLGIRELGAAGQVTAAAKRVSYLAITYVEPFDGNANLVGLDLSTIPRYAALFAAARQSGSVVASPPVNNSLVAGAGGPMLLVAYPLATNTKKGGYALGVLELNAILRQARTIAAPGLEAQIAWQSGAQPKVAASGQALNAWLDDASFGDTANLKIGGTSLILALRSVARPDPVTAWYVPAGAMLLVLALTTLLAQTMSASILRRRLVERAVVARTAELKQSNALLRAEISHRKDAEAELRTARDRAEASSRSKSAFMAAMSHELRTPLNAIIGFSGLIVQREIAESEYAAEILAGGKRLLDIINDILDLTEMETASAGQGLVYLGDVVESALAAAAMGASFSKLHLAGSIAPDLPPLLGDSKRIARALSHLIGNAVKFTPAHGEIQVAARLEGDGTLSLEVRDTGPGMTCEKIREAFSQQDARLTRQHEGLGLGLTYVSKVAELHQAKLDITSGAGRGTIVRLTFPVGLQARRLEVA